jgi:phospholipid/cholesterol/gamma-HCH transport system permease protein
MIPGCCIRFRTTLFCVFLTSMIKSLFEFGRYILFLTQLFRSMERFSIYWRETMREIVSNGMSSILLVIIISTFIGAVATVQTAYQLEGTYFPISVIGSVVSASALLEMAPSITSLVLAGKIGSSISSQIGTMKITEQIDALEVMGINAVSYLVLPKVLGCLLSFPCLVIAAAFFIHIGGIISGSSADIITFADFMYGAQKFHENFFVFFMIIKATTFGFIISTVAAYQGYYVDGGAVKVGVASTRAVVYSCIFILISNYLLAELLL